MVSEHLNKMRINFSFSKTKFYELWSFITDFKTQIVSQTYLKLELPEN